MIQKIYKAKAFAPLLSYLNKSDAECLGGRIGSEEPSPMAQEFSQIARLNGKCQKPAFHASLSVSPSEGQLDSWMWRAIARDYLNEMGFDQNQYVVYRHNDSNHDHIHIAANRVRLAEMTTVSEVWDYYRGQEIVRGIEASYGLQQESSSWERLRKTASQPTWKGNREAYQQAYQFLQDSIEQVAQQADTLPALIGGLEKQGIILNFNRTREGKVQGVQYGCYWQESFFQVAGSKLGKAFSYGGLQKHLSVSCEEALESKSPEYSGLEKQLTQQFEHILTETGHCEVTFGENQQLQLDQDSGMLTYAEQGKVQFQCCRGSQGHWQPYRNELEVSQMQQLIEQAESIISNVIEMKERQQKQQAKKRESPQLEA